MKASKTLLLQIPLTVLMLGCAVWLAIHRHRPADHLTDAVVVTLGVVSCASLFANFRQAMRQAGL